MTGECLLYTGSLVSYPRSFQALSSGHQGRGWEWIYEKKVKNIHIYQKHCLHIYILFLSMHLFDKYFLSVIYMPDGRVSQTCLHILYLYGCSCNKLNVNPFRDFTEFVMSLLPLSIFSMDARVHCHHGTAQKELIFRKYFLILENMGTSAREGWHEA